MNCGPKNARLNLKHLVLNTIINHLNLTNPNVNNENISVTHLTKWIPLGLDYFPKESFTHDVKTALFTAKSMIEDEFQVLRLRFHGTIRPRQVSNNLFGQFHTVFEREIVRMDPLKTVELSIRIHSVFNHNVTEITITAKQGIMHPNQIMQFLFHSLDRHNCASRLTFVDIKTIFWFRRPGTDYGWKLSFNPNWKVFEREFQGHTEEIKAYLMVAFDTIGNFVANDMDKFKKENRLDAIEQSESNFTGMWNACPCGASIAEHEFFWDPFLDICLNYDHI